MAISRSPGCLAITTAHTPVERGAIVVGGGGIVAKNGGDSALSSRAHSL
jgi:hypothetical protein